MPELDLNFIVRQNERLLTEMGSVRDDISVLTAIVLRQDATLTAVLNELRAMHAQIARIVERVRKLEEPIS